jgi:hypothetical protein
MLAINYPPRLLLRKLEEELAQSKQVIAQLQSSVMAASVCPVSPDPSDRLLQLEQVRCQDNGIMLCFYNSCNLFIWGSSMEVVWHRARPAAKRRGRRRAWPNFPRKQTTWGVILFLGTASDSANHCKGLVLRPPFCLWPVSLFTYFHSCFPFGNRTHYLIFVNIISTLPVLYCERMYAVGRPSGTSDEESRRTLNKSSTRQFLLSACLHISTVEPFRWCCQG